MRKLFTLASLLFFFSTNAQTVSTQFGQVQGHQNGTVYEFLGIPFAKPPVDSLRWKAPQNPDTWATTLVADSFAPACPQKYFSQVTNINGSTTDSTIGNEDCLYLNVWTPNVSNTANLPVLVFIHGGGNQQGSASEVDAGTYMYHGKNMAARGNAVVVTIQYRLGPLGFLVHPGLDAENANGKSGNYAVLDQILALKWVKNNISNFGGDTSKTLVFGESAGGVNTGNLLASPLAANLFTRAGIESAGPVVAAYTDAQSTGISFVDTFTNTGTDVQKIAYMRSLSADSLVKFETQPMSGGIAGSDWGAVLDNYVFTDNPFTLFRNGNFNHVPLLIGSNADETQMTSPQTVTPAMVNQLVSAYFPSAFQSEILAMYPPGTDNTTARTAYVGITTDAQFTDIVRRTAQCVSANQSDAVWRYFFTYTYPAPQLASMNLGSYHGMELLYVFNNWENINGHQFLFKPQDDSLQQVMLHYWVNFANTGNPNNGTLTPFANWQQYNANTDCYVEIKAEPNGTQCGLRTTKTNMWDSVLHFAPCLDTTTTPTGIAAIEKASLFAVFPNPAQNNFTVELSSQNFDITVYDIAGRKVFEQANNFGKTEVDCSKFENGTYILRSGNFAKKIVVCH